MDKLFVPYDGSENAGRALRHAIERARALPGTEVHVAVAYEAPVYYPEIGVYIPWDRLLELQEAESAKVLGPAKMALQEAGVPHTTQTVRGRLGSALAERAEELGCTEIVMGTRGMNPLGNLVLGSVVTRVVHETRLPVTVVK